MTEQTIKTLKKENEMLRAAAEESQRKYNELFITHRKWMELHEGKLIRDVCDAYKLMTQNAYLREQLERAQKQLGEAIKWNNESYRYRVDVWLIRKFKNFSWKLRRKCRRN